MFKTLQRLLCAALANIPVAAFANDPPVAVPALRVIEISSSLDGLPQRIRYWDPETPGVHPVLVSLHSWSGDCMQDHSEWLREAVNRQWVFIEPNFRGVNDHSEACGSTLARQDVIDAIDWALELGIADRERIYLAGVSGGGHMTMMMAAFHHRRISAASAWVGISDLQEWHAFHSKSGEKDNYALMTEACCGGQPGSSAEVDLQFFSRSPIHFLQHAANMPLDLNAGITDGKSGSVPIQHTLNAFNVIAKAQQTPQISATEIEQLWTTGRLESPQKQDQAEDPTYGRQIHLRRSSGPSRVTLFEGGHEGLAHPACEWLAQQKRRTRLRGQ